MFKNLLVALDGSAQSERIVPLATSLAHSSGSELHLLRVIDEHATHEQIDEAVSSMAATNTSLVESGMIPDVRISRGQVADQILRAAEDVRADVVLMTTTGHSGLTHALLGSTTEQVLARATVPVMAIGSRIEGDTTVGSILVPRDGSPGSAQALSAAKSIARATGARIELLHVVEPPLRYLRGKYIEPEFEEQTRLESENDMHRLASRLQGLGFAAEGRAVLGQPAATIVAVADEIDADLIVMATNGMTDLASKILGSVTHEVLRTAHAPLLLLHCTTTEGLAALGDEAEDDAQHANIPGDGGSGGPHTASTSTATLAQG
jgi:nucleotide-binding universal stress UspA family protein